MEKEKFFMNEGITIPPTWTSSMFGMEIQSNELNCSPEQLPNHFFYPNWDNSMDQGDPFESALSSIVSSPVNSNAGTGIPIPGSGGESIVLRELIGRLGSIYNSGDISPQSYINGNNSTNTSCYNTPLNSPPKLNLSMVDNHIRGNLPIPGNNQLPAHPNLAPFSTDPGFAERAARFSCFGGGKSSFAAQIGLKESVFPHRVESEFPHRVDSGRLSRVLSNQSFKIAGSQSMGVQKEKDAFMLDGIPASDKKFSRLSMSSTPENTEVGDSMEESSVSEQIPGGDVGMKGQSNANANARKRKSIPRGKSKENPSTPSANNAKVAAEKEESNGKRSKSEEEADGKEKGMANGNGKAGGDGNQKQTKDNPEPPKDYIHVRARRGQATDSHSLAERVRREKISERMKFLQDLVPGCNKVTGKAVMLDEIINYVQSLQRQVEFLSMKLATVNPRIELSMEALLSKDIFQSRGSMPQNMYPLDTSAHPFPYAFQSQNNGIIPNGTENLFSMNPSTPAIHRISSMKLPHIDSFSEAASQASTFWENDLQTVVQMGLGQNQPQSFQGAMAAGQMKVEP